MQGRRIWLAAAAIALGGPPAATASAHGRSHKPAHHRIHHHRLIRRSFVATVVRASASGVELRTSSGHVLTFSASEIQAPSRHKGHARAAARAASGVSVSSGSVVINIQGLQSGTTVDVTETIAPDGTTTITITLPSNAVAEQLSGTVTDVEDDVFTVVDGDGNALHLHMSADQLAQLNLQPCDTVVVSYHSDAGLLIADCVTVNGASTTGDCAPTSDTNGVITAVGSDSVSIDTGQGVVTYAVDPSSGLTDGFQQGDLVDVTSTSNPDGSLQAIDINYVEEEASGVVTSITTSASGGSLTLTDSTSGSPLTVYADPSNGVEIDGSNFSGVSVGDNVTVSYHQAAGQLIADTVCLQ